MNVRWPVVAFGLVLTTVLALTVHAVMLQGLHVPYPFNYPRHGWPKYPDFFVFTAVALYTVRLLDQRFQRLSAGGKTLMFFLLLATLKESLFRAAFMNIVNSNSVLYPVVQAMPKLITFAITAACIVLSARLTQTRWSRWAAAVAISLLVFFLCQPLINVVFDPLLGSLAWRSGPSLYDPPYDYHILIPAYLSFLEPVIASFFLAALVWKELPTGTAARIGVFTFLILGLKGPVFEPILNIHFAHTGPLTAFLSEAQFSFESITLGLLTALTWEVASRQPAPGSRCDCGPGNDGGRTQPQTPLQRPRQHALPKQPLRHR